MNVFLRSYGLEFVLLCMAIALVRLGLKAKRPVLKHVIFNVSAIFTALLIYEFILTLNTRPEPKVEYSHKYIVPNPELGYSAVDSTFRVGAIKRLRASDEEVYKTSYSFANGKRRTPNSDQFSQKYALFLGGSCMFGEGVNDNETLPFYYNDQADKSLNIRNYAFHGYGTHQVYTIAKNQIVSDTDLLAAKNVDVFYWFISPHILRANGFAAWDLNGPRYTIENGQLSHTGSFSASKSKRHFFRKCIDYIWTNSALGQGSVGIRLSTREKQVDLFLELVKETDQTLKEKGFTFTIFMEDMTETDMLFGGHYRTMMSRIRLFFMENNIQFIDISQLISQEGIDVNRLKIPGDGHPTREFHKFLAGILWKHPKARITSPKRVHESGE